MPLQRIRYNFYNHFLLPPFLGLEFYSMKNLIFSLTMGLLVPYTVAALPEQIVLKTKTETFTDQFEFALEEGKIWMRSIGGTWEELVPSNRRNPAPERFKEISADGQNLIAVGEDNVIYYMKTFKLKWMPKWGMPFRKRLLPPLNNRGLSISHRGPYVGGYEDIDGVFHKIGAGVTTLYALSEDGLKITYADPWLPPKFNHSVCGPKRNRFVAESMSASASTLFVINRAGEMFTRLADFDTVGTNPFLKYTFDRKANTPEKVRSLPGEDWFLQPRIKNGIPTKNITIFASGKGNAGRTLRVEGVNEQNESGFFEKNINASEWTFVPVPGKLLTETLLTDKEALLGPSLDKDLAGTFKAPAYELTASLVDFNPECSPATLELKIGGTNVNLIIHHISLKRARLVIPEEVMALENKEVKDFLLNVFSGKRVLKVKIKLHEGGLTIKARKGLFGKRFTFQSR